MPKRISRAGPQAAQSKAPRNKNRKRNLDAYSIASHAVAAKNVVRPNRLGELLDDPPPKRRRVNDEDGEDDDEGSMDEGQSKPVASRGVQSDGIEEGNDSDGNEWTLGGLREDDDDSELDSDEAFGESDEERFAGFTFRGSSSNKGKKAPPRMPRVQGGLEGDLNEDGMQSDDDDEDDFGDEGVALDRMLDNDNQSEDGPESGAEEDDGSAESSADSVDEEDLDGDDEERIARMRDRVEALDAPDTPTESIPKAQSTMLTVEDLLAGLDPAARKQFHAPLKTRKKSEQPKTLTAPLAPRQQSKLDREAASKKAKEQLDRWKDTVVHNRRAEFLSFPLRNSDEVDPVGKDTFVKGKPQNELEENIRKIMEESGITKTTDREEDDDEDGLANAEGLPGNKLSVEEVAKRRADLRRARELLFREEVKAKRIAKIKSKSYRRVHRRERERQRELEAGSDQDDDLVADRKRAEARMSTKHRDSKWAKSLKATNRAAWDEEARSSVHDQARRDEELRRRVAGNEEHDEDSDISDEELGVSDEEGAADTMKQLDRIQQHRKGRDEQTGLAGMKFMRVAEERRRKQNDEDVERLRKELAAEDGESDNDDDEVISDQGLGRAVFGPKGEEKAEALPKPKRPELEEGDPSDQSDVEQEIVTESTTTNAAKPKRTHARFNRDEVMITTSASTSKQPAVPTASENTQGWTDINFDMHNSGEESAPEQPDAALTREQQRAKYHQRAFAGDAVKAAFDAEKAAVVVDKEASNYLPGWGSWTGEGLSKSIRKAANRQQHNPIYKTKLAGVRAADRKDAKLENVMISEKQDRKGKKYKADILPHEFEKQVQYERSLRIPMGPEWVTKETFQKNTRPRVVVKPGVVVAPMERPLL